MVQDIPFDKKMMKVITGSTIWWGIIFGIIFIGIGILNNVMIDLLWGIAAIIPVVIVLLNRFKTYKILNILNIFLMLLSFNIPGIYYSLIVIVFYGIIYDNQDYIDESIISIDENTIKNIKISTIMSIVYMIIYISLLIIYYIYHWYDVYFFFTDNSMGLGLIAIGLFAILFRLLLLGLMVLILITPIIILYMNMLFNYKAIKYRELKYFKSLMIFGVLSLTFINSFAARKLLAFKPKD